MILIINVIKSLPAGMTNKHLHNSDGCSPNSTSRDYVDRFIVLNSADSQGKSVNFWKMASPRKIKLSISLESGDIRDNICLINVFFLIFYIGWSTKKHPFSGAQTNMLLGTCPSSCGILSIFVASQHK